MQQTRGLCKRRERYTFRDTAASRQSTEKGLTTCRRLAAASCDGNAFVGGPMSISGRRLLQGSTAFAASFAIGRHFARAAGASPFSLGVASGDPSPEGFVLWTRLAFTPLAPDGHGGMSEPV